MSQIQIQNDNKLRLRYREFMASFYVSLQSTKIELSVLLSKWKWKKKIKSLETMNCGKFLSIMRSRERASAKVIQNLKDGPLNFVIRAFRSFQFEMVQCILLFSFHLVSSSHSFPFSLMYNVVYTLESSWKMTDSIYDEMLASTNRL